MRKILVAEDEQNIREFVVINLKRAGYEAVEAANGEEALRLYEQAGGSFDMAILDIMTGSRCASGCASRTARSASFC